MPDQKGTPIVIGAIIGFATAAVGAVYFFLFSTLPGGRVVQAIVLVGTVVLLGAIVVVVRRRLIEIEEEDPDDYRKY